jgi:protein TonB
MVIYPSDEMNSYFTLDISEKQQQYMCWLASILVNLAFLLSMVITHTSKSPEAEVMPTPFLTVELVSEAAPEAATAAPAMAAPSPTPVIEKVKPVAAPAPKPVPQKVEKHEPVPFAKSQMMVSHADTNTKAAPTPAHTQPISAAAEPTSAATTSNHSSASTTLTRQVSMNGPVTVTEPRYRRTTPPNYPEEAVDGGIEGTVILEARVSATGHPISLRVLQTSGSAALDEAAQLAVSNWEFEPYVQNGIARESAVRVPVKFALN